MKKRTKLDKSLHSSSFSELNDWAKVSLINKRLFEAIIVLIGSEKNKKIDAK